ncbi:MAG TPA: hypothetical protein VFV20_09460 [Candidatus Limnocylindria bacterium]|nr:hypothetical protein [Candidatus Limnocylindria bacterium]
MAIREDAAGAVTTLARESVVERAFVVVAGWLMTGVFLDAWAHISHLPDSFWTPWHGVLYSGLLACGAFLVLARSVERRIGRRLLAHGYGLSLAGFALGALGGIADAIWHTVFGVEFDIDAAVSPSHLLIAGAILLVVTGPVRAAWSRRSFGLPAALGLLYGISIITIIVDYAQPFGQLYGTGAPPAGRELGQLQQTVALFAFIAYAALLSGTILAALRAGPIAPAWFGLVAGGNMAALTLVNGPLHPGATSLLLLVALASAALITAAAALLRPAPGRIAATRTFAFAAPALSYAAYAVAVTAAVGTWWTPTFWCGLVAIGGLAGLLVSTLAAPSAHTIDEPQTPRAEVRSLG